MRKTFQYRLYPTKKQIGKLEQTLNGCRWLYNHLLEQRKTLWETEKKSISCFEQCDTLKSLKISNPFLNDIHSQVLQNIAIRIDFAFKAFFRRVKSGEKPGYPRFRGYNRYDSFTFPQSGYKVCDNYINLSKIGNIKINLHRPIEGIIKTCTIRRKPTGKWFISFACDIDIKPVIKPVNPAIGIDMGIESFATLSNGEKIDNPKFFQASEKFLAKAQRKLSTCEKGTPERRKSRKIVAHIHEKINNKRHNFVHHNSRTIINKFNTICIENLAINSMKKNNFRSMNKSIGDAAWRMFLECLKYKAEYAGNHCIQVNPAYTSQICSNCGHRHKLKLSERVYHCPICDFNLDRDHNASLNILRLGIQSLPVSG